MHETYDSEIRRFVGEGPRPAVSGPRLGIVGGGQLAKMTAMAALRLGCDVLVLERNSFSPAANLATHSLVGDWDDPEALVKLASQVDALTLENEFVAAESLAVAEELGCPLYPSARSIALVQDKFTQKRALAAAGVGMPRFRQVESPGDLAAAGAEWGWPLVLKARRNGYDGKGNATVRGAEEIGPAWRQLGGGARALYVEAWCPFEKELAVIVTRGRDGSLVTYPVVETVQRDHVCRHVLAPAPLDAATAARASELARRAVVAVDGVGSFGVELFLAAGGEILLNELAPRVHNSGHYTLEACACSQFENHVRAVFGWPLGSPALVAPAAAMVNLLGSARGPGRAAGLARALAVSGAHVHIYGKAMSGPGRKMGHVTALGASAPEALARAEAAAREIRFGTPA